MFDWGAAAGWATAAVAVSGTGVRAFTRRMADAARLESRIRHLESARDRQAKAMSILIKAHARATSAQRAGRSADAIVADLLDAHSRTVQELAEVEFDMP